MCILRVRLFYGKIITEWLVEDGSSEIGVRPHCFFFFEGNGLIQSDDGPDSLL